MECGAPVERQFMFISFRKVLSLKLINVNWRSTGAPHSIQSTPVQKDHCVIVQVETLSYSWPVGRFDVVSDYDDHSVDSAIARQIDGDISSSASFVQARKRLTICLSQHSLCHKRVSSINPTRLLDVCVKDQPEIVRLRSLDSTRLDDYVALSYCWGGDQFIKTTVATVQTHENGISIQDLPQTIQDAIRVTRELEVNFLWIDSLCIIQDSPEDVAKEIANMAHYFGNALVTICAAVPTRCVDGFLRTEDESCTDQGPFYFPMTPEYKWERRRPYHRLKFVPPIEKVQEAIDTRAWTLQEALLSSRLIIFGARCLRWSCSQANYGEFRLAHLRKTIQHAKRMDRFQYSNGSEAFTSSKQALDIWQKIVCEYTSRSLSFSNDRLPAIAGVARDFSALIKAPENRDLPKYSAGMWTFLLPLQLLWVPSLAGGFNSANISEMPQTSCAPSWSWASINAPIRTQLDVDSRYLLCQAKLIDCRVYRLLEEAPYGAVTGGFITLESRIKHLEPNEDIAILTRPFPNYQYYRNSPIIVLDTNEDTHLANKILDGDVPAWFLEIMDLSRLTDHKATGDRRSPQGLILVRHGEAKYQRVGVFYYPLRGAAANEFFASLPKELVTIV